MIATLDSLAAACLEAVKLVTGELQVRTLRTGWEARGGREEAGGGRWKVGGRVWRPATPQALECQREQEKRTTRSRTYPLKAGYAITLPNPH